MTYTAVIQNRTKDVSLHWYKYESMIKKNRKQYQFQESVSDDDEEEV